MFNAYKLQIILAIAAIAAVAILISNIPGLSTVEGWFGIETKDSLKKKLDQEKTNNGILTEANNANAAAAGIAKAETKIADEVLDHNDDGKKTIDHKVSSIKKHTDDKIKVIEASSATPEEKIVAKSTERALSIWRTYCSFNDNQDCDAIPVVTPKENKDVAQIQPDVDRCFDDLPDRLRFSDSIGTGDEIRTDTTA